MFDASRPVPEETQREIAYQWWGQTVGLKSFDDACSRRAWPREQVCLRETTLSSGTRQCPTRTTGTRADVQQTASIARAQRVGRSVSRLPVDRFYKGSMVFRMLRETIGKRISIACCARSWTTIAVRMLD
jgi:hypothetical protein